MNTQTKTLTFRVKDLGTMTDASGQEFGQIEAYGAIFNNVDEGNDRIIPGAFKRSISHAKDRASAREVKYLAPMLWQHDPNEMIGGWYEITEDATGLRAKGDINLATQRGREYYALAKAGMSDQFSIIYDIPSGGARYDKSGVRDLTEMRLFSIDPVTFAMNDATFVVAVKANADGGSSTAVGNTKGPIGPRDESWDGAKAEGQIWAVAYNDETSTVDKTTASKYFMVRSGDGTKKGDYSYPFWFVGSDPHICVGAVKAIAGAIQGSRGADAPDALKGKVASLYARINAKYPDDPQLTAPWNSGEKGASMPEDDEKKPLPRQRKTFETHYAQEQCQDALEDWQDVVLCAFTSAVYDALTIGDQPEADVADALNGLRSAVMDWVAEAIKYGLPDFLAAQSDTYDGGALYRMEHGSGGYGYYGYMSRQTPMHKGRKAMTASDATTGGFTSDHVDKLNNAATKAKDAVDRHVGMLQDAADEVKSLVSGATKAAKDGRSFSSTNAQALNDHADMLNTTAKSLQKSMDRQMKSITSVADDLATIIQGAEPAYTTDPGKPQAGQEGKSNAAHRASSDSQTRASRHTPPSSDDTASEDAIAQALTDLRSLKARTPAHA